MGFMDKVKSTVKSADDKLGNMIDSEKLDSKIRDEERNIEKLTAEIGQSVVSKLKEDKEIDMEAIQVLMAKIKDSEETIEKFKAEKEALKAPKEAEEE